LFCKTVLRACPEIEGFKRAMAGNPKVMQAASNLHDHVRNAFLGEAQNIFDNATAFDAGDNIFDPYL
jgi:hypothetical protein